MARQVLPIVGAVAGFVISGGNPMGAQAGFAIGSLIGNAVDPLEVQGNKIGDNPLQTASEGGTRAIVFGKGCIRATCLLERGNRIVRKTRDQAGKGGGPVTINERVYWTFAIGLGEDLIGGAILRIWEGEKLVYDVTPGSAIPAESAQFAQKFRFYDGAEDQLPDPDLEAIHGVGNAPYYRGTAYVVFPNFDLTDYREAIPTYRWEVAKEVGVAAASVLAMSSKADTVKFFRSPDGQSWPDPGVEHSFAQMHSMIAAGDRFVAWGIDGVLGMLPRYTLDYGIDWTASVTYLPDVGGSRMGCYANGSVVIGGGLFGVSHSADGANSFDTDAEPKINFVTQAEGFIAGISHYSDNVFTSSSGGSAWVEHGGKGISIALGGCGCLRGSTGYFGGSDGGIPSAPALVSVSAGGAVSNITLPDFGPETTFVSAIAEGEGVLVIGTDGGEIAARIDGVWQVPDFVMPDGCTALNWNGTVFNVVGGNSLAYSSNGLDWTTVTLVSDDSENLTAIASLPAMPQVAGAPIQLSSIVSAIHQRCGHTSADYDVSELTDMLAGVVLEQSATGAEAINSIIGGYFADPTDYDAKIHYIKRGNAVQRTLTYDDLIDEPETTRRENAIEYPRKLHLFAQTSWTAYAATKSTSSRSSPDLNAVVGEVSVSIPVTFDGPDEPAQIAAKLHKVNWTDAEGEIVWQVTDEHADLVPTDCIGLSLRGRLTRARITGIEDSPGIRKLTMRVDRQSAYTSDVTGIPLQLPTPPQPSILAPTINAYLDIPALRDGDDQAAPVYYDAMSGQTDVWSGAMLQRSLDGGAGFSNVSATATNAIMGTLQEGVSAASPYYTDTTNAVVVRLYMDDEIHSLTDQQFMSEQGAFALSWMDGDVRRWEVMQYRDAELIADRTYRLTTLHRGQLNTAGAAHPPGSLFVLLDSTVRVVTAQAAWIGTDLTHRAVSNGLSPETAATTTEPFTAQSQTEWPVAHVLLERAGDDVLVEIVPRYRFGTDDNPVRSINWTAYRVTATDGTNTATVETTSDTHTFDATGWASPITVTVAQLNRITGAGPTVSEDIA